MAGTGCCRAGEKNCTKKEVGGDGSGGDMARNGIRSVSKQQSWLGNRLCGSGFLVGDHWGASGDRWARCADRDMDTHKNLEVGMEEV